MKKRDFKPTDFFFDRINPRTMYEGDASVVMAKFRALAKMQEKKKGN